MKVAEEIFEDCDPDSSPYVWNNLYKIIYRDNWFFDQAFDVDKLRVTGKRSEYRYLSVNSIETLSFPQFNEWLNEIKLGGDTDFNFKIGCKRNRKYEFYKELIENEVSFNNLEKEKYLNQLNECKDRYHSLDNFSLTLVTGGLNNFKGSLSQDRVDRFIFLLNDYFELRDTIDYEHIVFSKAVARNKNKALKEENTVKLKRILHEYLNLFINIEDYCYKIYKLSDRELISRLIALGSKKTFDSGQDVVEYMDLAMRYWENKARILKYKYL